MRKKEGGLPLGHSCRINLLIRLNGLHLQNQEKNVIGIVFFFKRKVQFLPLFASKRTGNEKNGEIELLSIK